MIIEGTIRDVEFVRAAARTPADPTARDVMETLGAVIVYCCGDAGKMRDLMTTGTAPEEGISAPISM